MLCRKDTERSKTILPMLTRELLAPVGRNHISKQFVAVPVSVVFSLQTTSSRLICFVPHQSAIVVFTYVKRIRRDPGVKAP